MMQPVFSVSGVKSVVGKFVAIPISAATATQVWGSSTDPATGYLSNRALSALASASSATPSDGKPNYYSQLVQLSDPSQTIYVGRDSNVSNTNFEEVISPGSAPLQYEASGSYPIWVYSTVASTINLTASQ